MVGKNSRNCENVCVQSSQLVKITSSIGSGAVVERYTLYSLAQLQFLELVSIFSYRPVPYMQIHDFVLDLSNKRVLVVRSNFLATELGQFIQLVFKAHKGKLLFVWFNIENMTKWKSKSHLYIKSQIDIPYVKDQCTQYHHKNRNY